MQNRQNLLTVGMISHLQQIIKKTKSDKTGQVFKCLNSEN